MRTNTAFWDSSALVLLCIQQSESSRSRQIARQFPKRVVWWAADVEVESALCRLRRDGKITTDDLRHARQTWKVAAASVLVVEPTESLHASAREFPERFGLRAMDAFQLAAALAWCQGKPKNRVFVCFDKRLAEAAKHSGFNVLGYN